jgi:receptor expression-enhancing protein 1/2/3/4
MRREKHEPTPQPRRFPFYWELKTLFLLFLSLPQTQGSSWLYATQLEPYLSANEADIDDALAAAQSQTVTFAHAKFAVLWDAAVGLLNRAAPGAVGGGAGGQAQNGAPQHQQPGAAPAQPHGQTPAQAPWVDTAKGLWSAYGPSVVGAIQRSTARGPSAPAPAAPSSSSASSSSTSSFAQGASSPPPPPPTTGFATGFDAAPTGARALDPRRVPLPPSGMSLPSSVLRISVECWRHALF